MWAVLAAAAVAAAAFVYLERQSRSDEASPNTKCRKRQKKGEAFSKDMQEREYLPLIPETELRRVKALLKQVVAERGWGATSVEQDRAWQRALAAAKAPEGGAWGDCFDPAELEPARLRQLATVLDDTFLGGALAAQLRRQQVRPLDFVIDDEFAGKCDWLSYFHESNAIHLLRRKWSQPVSDEAPMSCEGVLCTTRLQLLAHTVAHEMVHAVVFHFWPDIDKSSEAYLPCNRHGPIFKLLNKRLFGHLSDSYNHVFRIPAAGN